MNCWFYVYVNVDFIMFAFAASYKRAAKCKMTLAYFMMYIWFWSIGSQALRYTMYLNDLEKLWEDKASKDIMKAAKRNPKNSGVWCRP